jgi:hypothetical protein
MQPLNWKVMLLLLLCTVNVFLSVHFFSEEFFGLFCCLKMFKEMTKEPKTVEQK